jgi:hypothetical protein
MRSLSDVEIVLALFEAGLSNRRISILTGISRTTIRDWRRRGRQSWKKQLREPDRDCPLCSGAEVPWSTYAYLLGLYLGDGCISAHPRGVYRLRITLDLRYPGIIDDCAQAMREVRPSRAMKVGRVAKIGCVEVGAYWKHWPCLFPQHGPGPKHRRPIKLHAWQLEIVGRHPDRLLRGLIQSDGWRGSNRVKGRPYPRYNFNNRSADIRGIFCLACDLYGIRWRQMNAWTISIARAADVAKLDLVVGPKS